MKEIRGPERKMSWKDPSSAQNSRFTGRDPKHEPISQWVVCRNQEAIELMVAVYPHMGERRRARIREVLAQFEKRPA